MTRSRPSPTLYCNFCGKSQHDVAKMIAGPTIYVCDECVDMCHALVHDTSFTTPIVPLQPRRAPPLAMVLDDWGAQLARITNLLGELRDAVEAAYRRAPDTPPPEDSQ